MFGSLSDPLSPPPSFCSSSGHTLALRFVCARGPQLQGVAVLLGTQRGPRGEGGRAPGSGRRGDLEGSEKDEGTGEAWAIAAGQAGEGKKADVLLCCPRAGSRAVRSVSEVNSEKPEEAREARGRSSSRRLLSEHHPDT